jgi:hypothetical protein
MLVLLSVYHSYHLYVTGGFDRSLTRAEFYRVTGDLQWWRIKFMVVACAAFLLLRTVGVYFATRRHRARFLASLACSAVVPWIAVQLYVGSRHQVLLLVLLALVLLWLFAGAAVRRGTILLGVPAVVVLFMLIGVVRQTRSANTQTVQPAIEALGEFVFPYQVLMVVLEPDRARRGGETYLRSGLFWIPPVLWPSKPRPLQEDFMADLGEAGVVGFGFNPVAEAVENFGSIGPILFGVGFASLLILLQRSAHKVPLIYILVLTQTVFVWRSELTTIAVDVILFTFMISLAAYSSMPLSRLAQLPLTRKAWGFSPINLGVSSQPRCTS